MSAEALKFEIPKLPQLDKDDVKAVRSFLPGKLLSRTAALLSLVSLVVGFAILFRIGLHRFLDFDLPLPVLGLLIGLLALAVVAQMFLEWRAERNRAALQALAVKAGVQQAGYFRIGPYQDTDQDRAKFSRPDGAEKKVLEWLKKSALVPLYLTGDSGSGKSSLLNAFVLPKLRESDWTVLEVRAWQDPESALRDAMSKFAVARRAKRGEGRSLREIIEELAKRKRLLIVIDQFEEFLILGNSERHQEFAAFVNEMQARPVKGLTLLLVLRSDYQMLLEEIGLPVPRSGENLFQVSRFQLSAATAFMKQSGLDLVPKALDDLVTSAAELDDTPGLVRPITLNVIGHVLASGKGIATSLDAGTLVRQYIEQTLQQPAIRGLAPPMLEQMITEQGTKRPRSESELASTTKLRVAEVRAVLNCLCEAGIARPLNPAGGVWELTHDFIARAVGRFLGRHRSGMLRRAGVYAAPALLALSLVGAVGAGAWNRFGPDHVRSQLADLGVTVRNDINTGGMIATAVPGFAAELPEAARLLQSLSVQTLDLHATKVENVEPLKGLTALRSLNLHATKVENVEPLKGLTALRELNLSDTEVENVEPLKGLTALQRLYLGGIRGTEVENVEPLKGLTALQVLYLNGTKVENVEPLKGLTALQELDLTGTKVENVEPLKGLTALQTLHLSGTKVENVEPLKGLTALQEPDLTGTKVENVEPLKGLTALQELYLSGTKVENVEPLKGLTALRELNLSDKVENVEPLKGLTALRSLYLKGTTVENVEPLKGLTALQRLNLSDTKVENVEPLKGLTALQWLYLTGTKVENVEPLKGLTALRELDLTGTKVENVEPLKGLTALRELDLTGTKVENVEPLKGLTAKGLTILR